MKLRTMDVSILFTTDMICVNQAYLIRVIAIIQSINANEDKLITSKQGKT